MFVSYSLTRNAGINVVAYTVLNFARVRRVDT